MSDSEPELREAQAPTPDATGVPTPPPTTDTDALESLAVLFQDSTEERHVPRKQVISWAFWDWATQPFNSVILTFVFAALYLVSDSFLPADVASLPDDSPVKEAALADLAIEGEGFFIVSDGNEDWYTRDGTFAFDTNGKQLFFTGCFTHPCCHRVDVTW